MVGIADETGGPWGAWGNDMVDCIIDIGLGTVLGPNGEGPGPGCEMLTI